MRIGQNGPLKKFTRFLFMHLNVACITNIWRNNIYADTNLCDRRSTRIIRINKTRTEKCRFMVLMYTVIVFLLHTVCMYMYMYDTLCACFIVHWLL